MRKHKSVVAILLAVMMIFTFMPTMAFANDPFTGHKTNYTDARWTGDFHTAQVTFEDVQYSSGVAIKTTTKTQEFEFYDQVHGMEASKTDVTKSKYKFFVAYVDSNYNFPIGKDAFTDGTVTYGLCVARAVKTEGNPIYNDWDYDYVWDIANAIPVVDYSSNFKPIYMPNVETFADTTWETFRDKTNPEFWTRFDYSKEALKYQTIKENVYDATYMIAHFNPYNWQADEDYGQLSVKVDAGKYSAWKQSKGDCTANPAAMTQFGSLINDSDNTFYNVEYPDYNAYAVNGKDNQVVKINISLNADVITGQYGPKNVSTATRTIDLEANVDNNEELYFAQWHLEGDDTENEYNVEDQILEPGEKPEYGINDGVVIYKGSSYKVVLDHPAENTTVKYFVSGTHVDPKTIKAADWSETQPEIKNQGKYYVYLQFTTTKGNTTYTTVFSPEDCHKAYKNWRDRRYYDEDEYVWYNDGRIIVEKYAVPLTFTQEQLTVEYGKYTLAELEDVIAKLVTVGSTPDSADKVAAAFNKYKVFKGLFEEAGESTVGVNVDTAKVAKDADLAAALDNYEFNPSTLWMRVEKVANNVELKAPSTKVIKAGKKNKKLKKNKSFKISATARYGSVSFSKVSGNNKIKVSKTGKITVKKGLKKGKTYKVKVKALAQGTANYAQASAVQLIRVKIK